MLRQATVEDISNQRVTRVHGRIVVVTRYYPRYLKKNLIHAYVAELAPVKALLAEFKAAEESIGDHDRAFVEMDYESKFTLSRSGLEQLAELAEQAQSSQVYLVCHCKIGQRCHREILMLIARAMFGTPIAKVSHTYETLLKRVPEQLIRD